MLEMTNNLDEHDLSASNLWMLLTYHVPLEEKVELLAREMIDLNWRIVQLTRIVRKLHSERVNDKGHLVNIEGRVYALEERSPRKKRSYKYR